MIWLVGLQQISQTGRSNQPSSSVLPVEAHIREEELLESPVDPCLLPLLLLLVLFLLRWLELLLAPALLRSLLLEEPGRLLLLKLRPLLLLLLEAPDAWEAGEVALLTPRIIAKLLFMPWS